MKRTKAAKQYKWDFKHLYANNDSWKKDLMEAKNIGEKLLKLKGHLHDFESFKNFFKLDEELNDKFVKLSQYLHYGDIDTTDSTFTEMSGLFQVVYYQINQQLSFVENEITSIGEEEVQRFLHKDAYLKNFSYYIRNLFKNAKYLLDPKAEKLLAQVARSRNGAAGIYDTLVYADKKKTYVNYKGKKTELTPSVYIDIMENTNPITDQIFRAKTNQKYSQHIVDKKHSLAKVYEANLISTIENVRLRKFDGFLQAALLGDNVDPEVYLNLIAWSKQNTDIIAKYGTLKKDYFGFDKYFPTDHSLKLSHPTKSKYDVPTAKSMIREALKQLGPEYANYIDKAWADNLIDYYPDTNKRDGAYSSGGGVVDPIILMNWDDSLRSVATLAHETGHSIHSLIATAHQPYPLYEYPIILAEIASTVNEHLLFDYLIGVIKDKQTQIYLLQNRIDDIIGTFFRQIQFAEFEYQIHEMVSNNEPLTADKLADKFEELANTYSNNLFDKYDSKTKPFSWPRILHFFHAPFYVYKYATSIAASFKFYQNIKEGSYTTFIDFLKAGGHKEPLNILKDFGIDFKNTDIYKPLMAYLENLVKQLQQLLKDNK